MYERLAEVEVRYSEERHTERDNISSIYIYPTP